MNFESFLSNKSPKPKYEIEDEHEKKEEELFKDFLSKVRAIKIPEYEEGEKEYVSLTEMHRVCKEIFGKDAIPYRTLVTRVINFAKKQKDSFLGDVFVDEGAKKGEAKYFINRKNTKLIKTFFTNKSVSGISDIKASIRGLELEADFLDGFD